MCQTQNQSHRTGKTDWDHLPDGTFLGRTNGTSPRRLLFRPHRIELMCILPPQICPDDVSGTGLARTHDMEPLWSQTQCPCRTLRNRTARQCLGPGIDLSRTRCRRMCCWERPAPSDKSSKSIAWLLSGFGIVLQGTMSRTSLRTRRTVPCRRLGILQWHQRTQRFVPGSGR